jgi:hypothetical protein
MWQTPYWRAKECGAEMGQQHQGAACDLPAAAGGFTDGAREKFVTVSVSSHLSPGKYLEFRGISVCGFLVKSRRRLSWRTPHRANIS